MVSSQENNSYLVPHYPLSQLKSEIQQLYDGEVDDAAQEVDRLTEKTGRIMALEVVCMLRI